MVFNRLTQAILFMVLTVLLACGQRSAPNQDTDTETPQPTPTGTVPTNTTSPVDSVHYQGIDVSHFQGDVDWTAVKAGGITFAFAKASQGASEVDPKFTQNWAGIKAAGLVRGAYHFFDPSVDAMAQAEHFIATVQLEAGDLPPMLDIEVSQGVSAEGIDADLQVWLTKVAGAYGVTPIIYSDLSFISTYLDSGFSAYPLWIADYSDTAPTAPGDWDTWLFWQYSSSGAVSGVDGAVDRDVYQGTEARWEQLLKPADR